MGSLREVACDRNWGGGLGLAHSRLGSVEFVVSVYRIRRRLTLSIGLSARARRAATGRAACELWGLCAEVPAIEIGEGGLVSLTPDSAPVSVSCRCCASAA